MKGLLKKLLMVAMIITAGQTFAMDEAVVENAKETVSLFAPVVPYAIRLKKSEKAASALWNSQYVTTARTKTADVAGWLASTASSLWNSLPSLQQSKEFASQSAQQVKEFATPYAQAGGMYASYAKDQASIIVPQLMADRRVQAASAVAVLSGLYVYRTKIRNAIRDLTADVSNELSYRWEQLTHSPEANEADFQAFMKDLAKRPEFTGLDKNELEEALRREHAQAHEAYKRGDRAKFLELTLYSPIKHVKHAETQESRISDTYWTAAEYTAYTVQTLCS